MPSPLSFPFVRQGLIVLLWSTFAMVLLGSNIIVTTIGSLSFAAGALATSQYLLDQRPHAFAPLMIGAGILAASMMFVVFLSAPPLYQFRCWLLGVTAQAAKPQRMEVVALAWLAAAAAALVTAALLGPAALAGAGLILLLATLVAGRALADYVHAETWKEVGETAEKAQEAKNAASALLQQELPPVDPDSSPQ